jgi:outer membrane protein assembly factor BamB
LNNRSNVACCALFLFATLFTSGVLTAEDWPRFRGDNGTGVSSSHGLPVEFGPKENVIWKVDTLRGTSSPIISRGRLYFSSYEGDRRTLHGLDAATGATHWTRSVTKVRTENATPPNGPATPTPTTDGDRVFVLYPDAGLICYSTAGQEKWRIDLGPFHSMHGVASSLIVVDGRVIVVVDQLAGSYVAAFDSTTGKLAWKSERVDGVLGGYSTPSVYRSADGKTALVIPGPLEVVGYDAATGKRLWWIDGISNNPISVPVVWHKRAFVCEAVGEPVSFSVLAPFDKNKDGKVTLAEVKSNVSMSRLVERIDKGWGHHAGAITVEDWDRAFGSMVSKGGLVSIDLDGTGDVTRKNIRWSYRKAVPSISSALLYDDLVYIVRDGSILSAFDAASGKLVKQSRLQSHSRQYYASPVAADGKIFLLDVEGGVSVVKAGKDWKTLATNELGESAWATPAISDGRLYVRTNKSLFCFGK